MRWDPQSGQFSWTQGARLGRAAQGVRDGVKSKPNDVVALWRRDQPVVEELALTYRQLQEQVDQVNSQLDRLGDCDLVIFLPVSLLCLATLLACSTRPQIKHHLVLAGFSPATLASLLQSTGSDVVLTCTKSWPSLGPTLDLATSLVGKQITKLEVVDSTCQLGVDPSHLDVDPSDLEGDPIPLEVDLSPLFAL